MMEIERTQRGLISKRLKPNKVVIIFGARRVGKTVLMRQVANDFQGEKLLLNGEDIDTQRLLAERSAAHYRNLLKHIDLLIVDEAQAVPEIGSILKLIVDEVPNIRVLCSGSSSFDLLNKAGEPLVGRATRFTLLPISQQELSSRENLLQTRQNLESRLIYGSYPEVVMTDDSMEKKEYLRDIVNAYLLKDILSLDGLKGSAIIMDLLRLVAYQTGSEISYDEIGKKVGMSRNTVEKYMDLLSKTFVLFRLGGFARNLRKEVAKAGKWYFCDVGVRNAVINDFRPLALRQDTEIGLLWENYLIAERRKRNENLRLNKNFYFWKTYDRQEIDLIEEGDNKFEAFEIKWGDKLPKTPVAFRNTYPEASYTILNRNNYLDFIG